VIDDILISSWIVLDDKEDATAFPSTGSDSSAETFQRIYWHCVALFFASSRIHNPRNRHALFCNKDVFKSAPPDVREILQDLDIDLVTFPLDHRLPKGSVSRWGNQFYVLDIIKHFAANDRAAGLVLTDSDCIWRKPLATFGEEIFEKRCLLYTLRSEDQKGYEPGNLLNGMTHDRMKELVETIFDRELGHLPNYHGGEFFAADNAYCTDIARDFDVLWQKAVDEADLQDSIKEEAHFLSILAEARGIQPFTANRIIRRIWTHFSDINVQLDDMDLAIWHLPAEKRFGFARMYGWYSQNVASWTAISPAEFNAMSASFMGLPRRSPVKLMQDVVQKLGEKISDKLLPHQT
jgi:hypothetical protein